MQVRCPPSGAASPSSRTASAGSGPAEFDRYIDPFPETPGVFQLDRGENGGECTVSLTFPTAQEYSSEQLEALGLEDPCAPSEGGGGELLAPALVAELVWSASDRLPDPGVHIAPGHAITGLPAYLEVVGPQTLRFEDPPDVAMGYTLVTELTSVYDIRWGDEDVYRDVSSQGGPWNGPWRDEPVSYMYQYRNPENVVTVTQRWVADWTATAPDGTTTSGRLPSELETQTAFPLPVLEIQAVVER